ncbi:MAG: hypothetical protein HXS52_09635 [Theionarchaea archaeon]|nr:hypothetical protein [Theionarchaea archaeon]MBU7038184.1 hypothetical protein [Theionarchaea archaeon]
MKIETIFDVLGKALLWTVILFVILLVLYFFMKVFSAGIVVSLALLAVTVFLVWFYWKDVSPAASLRPGRTPAQEGKIKALTRVIERASKGYDVSREQVDLLVQYVTGEETHIEGKGEQYVRTLEEVVARP